MIEKTEGIVLSSVKYGERSLIVRFYTERFGLQSYIFNSVRTAKSKYPPALFQPFNLFEMVVYHQPHVSVQRAKELRLVIPSLNISSNIKKSSMAMFMAELILRTIPQGGRIDGFYEFIKFCTCYLEQKESNFENLHLHFIIQLCAFLGFEVESLVKLVYDAKALGVVLPDTLHCTEQDFMMLKGDNFDKATLNHWQRNELIDYMLVFMSSHVEHFKNLKSISILREVFGV